MAGPALAASAPARSFGGYTLEVPPGWTAKASPFPDKNRRGSVATVTNGSIAGWNAGVLDARQIVVTVVPLGSFGSRGARQIDAADFVPREHVAQPQVEARKAYCAPGGQCFSLSAIVAGKRATGADIAKVNGILASLKAAPAPR